MTRLFHHREEQLEPGSIVEPGRWGRTILAAGGRHPFFFREHLLEFVRRYHSSAPVSRLGCSFAHETVDGARALSGGSQFIYEVEPADMGAVSSRHDMVWLGWIGEAERSADNVAWWCQQYWSGAGTRSVSANATESWEHLVPCALRIIQIVGEPTTSS